VCHLDATMIETALHDWDLSQLDFLFIENVGNLVCPASYDLGEHLRVVLLGVTEGEDKPLKYPTIFNSADMALITKADLADAVGFDRGAAQHNIHEVRPGLEILETSARTRKGITPWVRRLEERAQETFGGVYDRVRESASPNMLDTMVIPIDSAAPVTRVAPIH
jgi:hydrogenase nickel incorporation protein HypB